ncbi:MAG: tetratricopeptide repeat protein [Nitrospirae bacterium]|nr:tetratricopeptide repeat protein [Nitrospirota bacterium]
MSRISILVSKPVIHLTLIALIGLLAYSNTFDSPFQWDEGKFITDNPIIKDLSYFLKPSEAMGLGEYYGALKNRYIGYLTFALNYKLHGLDVRGYHIVNLSIHILNALLVYFLVVLTFKTPYLLTRPTGIASPSARNDRQGEARNDTSPVIARSVSDEAITLPLRCRSIGRSNLIALFSALVFVSHPIQTEAVTYIFQRFASLCAFFYLLSIVLYIKWRLCVKEKTPYVIARGNSPEAISGIATPSAHNDKKIITALLLYLGSLLSAILAMKTKENAFTLPVVIMLYEFFFFKGSRLKRILYLVPLLLTMLIIPISLIGIDKPVGEIIGDITTIVGGYEDTAKKTYLLTQFRVIVTYIRLLFLPINQNIDYDYPVFNSFLNPQVFLSFLFLIFLFSSAFYFLIRSKFSPVLRLIAFGIFWFFIALSVESSIIPIPMVINEYRVYLPSVGVFTAIAIGAFLVTERLKNKKTQTAILSFLTLIPLVLSYATYARNTVWKSEISLWEDIIKKSPHRARAHNNLGYAYLFKGLIDKAIEQYLIAIRLKDCHKTEAG